MRTTRLSAVVGVLLIASCIEATGPNLNDVPGYLIMDVDVVPTLDTLVMNDSAGVVDRVFFRAVATGKNGDEIPDLLYFWESSDPTIATVNEIGVVTALRPGVVEISASADKIGTATLIIFPDPTPPAPPEPPPQS